MIRKMAYLVSASTLAVGLAAMPAHAQTTSVETTKAEATKEDAIIVTGSRIKQDPSKSALPLQIITMDELKREGVSSPEQMIMQLSANGNGADNLASNSDVVSGAQRGTNGLSAANLRGQGSGATLVLLNGRRVAAHGLSGSAVDVNQIPMAAIERVEVLKDGASAIYGTDAIGGVINYITRTNFKGVQLSGFTDFTEAGGGNIYSVSGTAGFGDLQEQGFNVMAAVGYRWNEGLRGDQRSFVNGNQPQRGLSVDTRGTPIATMFPLNTVAGRLPNGTLLGDTNMCRTGSVAGNNCVLNPNYLGNAAGFVIPGTTVNPLGGVNPLDLPGGAGCSSMDGGMPYDELLWANPSAAYACAWDTGRAAMLQQPIKTLTYYTRGTVKFLEDHQAYIEVTGSNADSSKRFSNAQVSSNTSNFPVAYPRNALTETTYMQLYNSLLAQFPGIAVNLGDPIAFRWRCIACGPREYNTNSKTFRISAGVEGPISDTWDYRFGAGYSRSETVSTLGTGYYYRGTLNNGANDPNAPTAPGATGAGLAGLINSGILNPFSLTQTPQAIAGLEAVSAYGASLYGGRYEVRQYDASVSGSLFALPGGDAKVAVGVDARNETYGFNGSAAAAASAPVIFLAAFDNVNALKEKERTVTAAYAEVLLPIFDFFEVTGAVRTDKYSGFGRTTNPKVSFKLTPADFIMFRGSYNTGFRVPSFNQIFNGRTESPYSGRDLADPVRCPGGVPNATNANCAIIQPTIYTGGNLNLGPEKAKQMSLGVVFRPVRDFTASFDWWKIDIDGTMVVMTERQLIENAGLFPERFIRDANGAVIAIDRTWINAGARTTQGLEVSLRGGVDALGGRFSAGMDGTYLIKKKEKLIPSAAWSPSLIGVFTFAGDLGLKWKHSAYINYRKDKWSISLSQLFRNGYKNQALPGIANGSVTRPDYNPRVDNYITYNLSTSYDFGGLKMTAGIKNLFDKDPPFAITYDSNTGAGGSWEPRVADPRGRAFTLLAEVKF